MMAGKTFVDTNVLLRSLIDQFPESKACREAVFAQRKAGAEMWISRQVVRELLVQLTHPRTLKMPLTPEQVQTQVKTVLTLFRIVDETSVTTQTLLTLVNDYPVSGKQIHDANIVSAMLTNSIDTLLTLNVADFNRYGDKIQVVVPGQETK